ncbi:sigma-70 family RNA polymerase sigma factor [Marinobacterium sp. YM272]|uniref:sigma-70 family RNA polymerase sigma factor n=1 Tax=Marinobacterium sp. YM272 TaxID=3421654 RepID=UPI003D7FFFE6
MSSPESSPPLTQLLERTANKDRQAFAALYTATSAKLYATVLRILKNEHWSEEVLQEAYIKVWQKAGSFDASMASPITWMATLARNTAIDQLRRAPAASADAEEPPDQLPGSFPDGVSALSQTREQEKLNHCLSLLESGRADLVRLAYLDGYSRADLAARFEQPVNTIKTWLHRALKQLKGCMN